MLPILRRTGDGPRIRWLLPIPYFHLVFTLPHTLNGLIRQNRRLLFNLLFQAASQTLLRFGAQRLKAQVGITAVLHTWSQTLLDHYHLHCIVTGGGVAQDRSQWKATGPHYLFPVRALSRMFRGKYLDGLQQLWAQGKLEFHGQLAVLTAPGKFAALVREAARSEWVVYAKRPFAGPRQVLVTPGWLEGPRETCCGLLKTPFVQQSHEQDHAFQLARIYFPQ